LAAASRAARTSIIAAVLIGRHARLGAALEASPPASFVTVQAL
jgi:hypothetical protein